VARIKVNKFLKMKAEKGEGKEEGKEEGITAKGNLKKAMNEVRRIEKAEKVQEKIVEKKAAITEKAKQKGDSESAEKAKSDEDEARAVLDKIRADKERAGAELKNAIAGQKQKPDEINQREVALADTDRETEASEILEQESEEKEEEVDVTETYPVNEPYAHIRIIDSALPLYEVREPELSGGEEELLKEIKTRLYETIAVSFAGVTNPDEFLREKVEAMVESLSMEISAERMDKIMYHVRRDFI